MSQLPVRLSLTVPVRGEAKTGQIKFNALEFDRLKSITVTNNGFLQLRFVLPKDTTAAELTQFANRLRADLIGIGVDGEIETNLFPGGIDEVAVDLNIELESLNIDPDE